MRTVSAELLTRRSPTTYTAFAGTRYELTVGPILAVISVHVTV
jgi:hypothetical protein